MKARVAVPADFAFRATVYSHGYFQTKPFAWDPERGVLERIDRVDGDTPRLVSFYMDGDALVVDAKGARPNASYLARVRRIFCLDADIAPFLKLATKEPGLRFFARRGFGRVLRTGDLHEDVVKAICGTNIQWKQAVTVIAAVSRFGTEGPDGRHAFPTPEQLVDAGEARLRAEGRTGYRAPYILQFSEDVLSGRFDREAFEREAPSMDGDAVRKRFLAVPGVGPATARYLAHFLGKHDAVSVDSAVIAHASTAHFGGARPTSKEVEAHYARYGEWRGLVSWFEVMTGWLEGQPITDLGK